MSPTTSAASDPALSPRCRGFLTDLVFRCGKGDEKALGDLFDLTYFFVAEVAARDAESGRGIDDRVVDAFARIWHRSPSYQPSERGPLAWVIDQVVDAEAPLGRAS